MVHALINVVIFVLLAYTFTSPLLQHLLIDRSDVSYLYAIDHKQIYIQLVIYTLFCYFASNFLFDLYHRARAKQLIISTIFDLLIIPAEILIMFYYNNSAYKHQTVMETSLYNIYLITAMLVAKELITGMLLSKKAGGKLNYKAR
jgi:hypothetical protein